jgi:hypothetical protein
MGGNDDQLADSYNILNKLEHNSVSYWICMILTLLYRKCWLAYIEKSPSSHQDQTNDNIHQVQPHQPELSAIA